MLDARQDGFLGFAVTRCTSGKKPQNNNIIPEESENSSLLFILITVDRFIEYLKLEGSHKDDWIQRPAALKQKVNFFCKLWMKQDWRAIIEKFKSLELKLHLVSIVSIPLNGSLNS